MMDEGLIAILFVLYFLVYAQVEAEAQLNSGTKNMKNLCLNKTQNQPHHHGKIVWWDDTNPAES